MSGALILRILTYVLLIGCMAAFLYASYFAYLYEMAMWKAFSRGLITSTNRPNSVMFAAELPPSCVSPRRKALSGLCAFFALALALAIVLYLRWP